MIYVNNIPIKTHYLINYFQRVHVSLQTHQQSVCSHFCMFANHIAGKSYHSVLVIHSAFWKNIFIFPIWFFISHGRDHTADTEGNRPPTPDEPLGRAGGQTPTHVVSLCVVSTKEAGPEDESLGAPWRRKWAGSQGQQGSLWGAGDRLVKKAGLRGENLARARLGEPESRGRTLARPCFWGEPTLQNSLMQRFCVRSGL